jgi:hypothetical protein
VKTFEIDDAIELRRCKRAQFSGWAAELSLNGTVVTGVVHSIVEIPSSSNRRWIVKIARRSTRAAEALPRSPNHKAKDPESVIRERRKAEIGFWTD